MVQLLHVGRWQLHKLIFDESFCDVIISELNSAMQKGLQPGEDSESAHTYIHTYICMVHTKYDEPYVEMFCH